MLSRESFLAKSDESNRPKIASRVQQTSQSSSLLSLWLSCYLGWAQIGHIKRIFKKKKFFLSWKKEIKFYLLPEIKLPNQKN